MRLRLAGPGGSFSISGARPAQPAGEPLRASGRVIIYNQDLKTLADIPDASLDAVVAVSALEHNTPESLPQVVAELMRVLKPGGLLLATLGAARDQDWFHEPSTGGATPKPACATYSSSRPTASSNYARYDELFNALKGLRRAARPGWLRSTSAPVTTACPGASGIRSTSR